MYDFIRDEHGMVLSSKLSCIEIYSLIRTIYKEGGYIKIQISIQINDVDMCCSMMTYAKIKDCRFITQYKYNCIEFAFADEINSDLSMSLDCIEEEELSVNINTNIALKYLGCSYAIKFDNKLFTEIHVFLEKEKFKEILNNLGKITSDICKEERLITSSEIEEYNYY